MQEKIACVAAVHRERYALLCDGEHIYGQLKTSVYFDGEQQYPTTGDMVSVLHNPHGDSLIIATHPRKSFFSRQDADKGRPREQAVAANFDFVFIVAALNQDFNLRRIERYLTLAWQSGATPVVALTKSDLCDDVAQKIVAVQEVAAGVAVHAVSALTGFGLDELDGYLTAGNSIVLLGSSGVGKSSLLNALAGADIMAVKAIREDDGKGRHTTTHRQLVELSSGAFVIDTPGMRELALWDASDGVDSVFADVEALIDGCRFSDCQHRTEPGCAVLRALDDGTLTHERWQSYQKLKREAQYADDRAAAMRARQALHKSYTKHLRSHKKGR